jgi:acetyl-CoA carboxylase biotin carboxyl carrier protein
MALSDRIRKLIGILKEEDLNEIEVRTWFSSIRVVRRGGVSSAATVDEPQEQPVPETKLPEPEPQVAEVPAQEDGLEEIVSPMVGTFYRSAGPEKGPFIGVGSRVETGQVLCIIEAMKLMNEIEAEKSGVIRKILAEDSQPVEFGQPLFLVESA